MTSMRTTLIGAAAVAAAAVGSGAVLATGSAAAAPAVTGATYSWYHATMTSYAAAGPAAATARLTSPASYRWLFGNGASAAPGWMTGARAPATVIPSGADPAQFIGLLTASAPGPRLSADGAAAAAAVAPVGAMVSKAASTITFTTSEVSLAILASRSGTDYSFQAAGLTNPKIIVPAGARVTVLFINADADGANGFVVLPARSSSGFAPASTWSEPAASGKPAFAGAALWFLGDPSAAGLHAGTVSFTASTPGSYSYLCPCPNHARSGMTGDFIVTPAK
jgi:hypothetical protein